MEIILKQDVPNLGLKDDVVSTHGYAAITLFPREWPSWPPPRQKCIGKHPPACPQGKQVRDEAQAPNKLAACQVRITTKVSSNGKVFGSVNNIQVAEALAARVLRWTDATLHSRRRSA